MYLSVPEQVTPAEREHGRADNRVQVGFAQARADAPASVPYPIEALLAYGAHKLALRPTVHIWSEEVVRPGGNTNMSLVRMNRT